MMFREFFWFELKFWLRGMMVWVFLGAVGLLMFGAVASDNVQVGGATESTYRNAAHTIQLFYGVISLIGGVIVTAFVNAAACRDFTNNTAPYLFSYPIRKVPYLMGRFWAAVLVSLIPMLGVSLGAIIGSMMPWQEPERIGPTVWGAHLWGFAVIAIPNCLLVASLIFAIAVWTRSTVVSFLGMLAILVGYSIAGQLTRNLDYESVAGLLDPFAISLFESLTKYWTVAEMNTNYLALPAPLLWNRLLWLAVSGGILAVTVWRFSFAERNRPLRGENQPQALSRRSSLTVPAASDIRPLPVSRQLLSQIAVDARGILSSNVFRAVMAFALFILGTNLWFSNVEMFGLSSLPVTYKMIDVIRGSLYIFLLAIITFFAGVLVWKEREARMDEVFDALPHPTWLVAVGKFVALMMVVVAVLIVGWLSGMTAQLAQGYYRFQSGVYLSELLGWDLIRFTCLSALAVLVHVVSPNKYIGYFGFVLLVIVNAFIWDVLEWESRMWRFASLPGYTYSDFFGVAPYLSSLIGFGLYWLLFAVLLVWGAIVWWPRGKERGVRARWKLGSRQWQGALRWGTLATMLVWLSSAAWVYYNTLMINPWKTKKQSQEFATQYETQFEDHSQFPQPRVTHIRYEIDIDPPSRGLELRGQQRMVNRSAEPIERLYVNTADLYETTLDIPDSTLEDSYPDLNYFIYRLQQPLEPGEEITIRYTVSTSHRGFENTVRNPELAQNGTFFNNMIVPQFGYQSSRELSNPNERRRRGLSPPRLMPKLDPDDLAARSNHYISNHSDWVEVESIISTTSDQIAIAPGSIQRKWVENDRHYYHYRLDHPSVNFYSFMSAHYEVEARKWNDVMLEVYYHPQHHWNVNRMLVSMRDTLTYCTDQFGPYRHRQARIIEFPRIASFAQAFPGTMPYSEAIGFIANLRDPEDIDMVYYVVAHEMGHQWWAHQVVGANMQGATVLSETLAQYTALMVMERHYGRDMMRKFLRHEMDAYLRSRGSELLRERPLIKVESGQGYIHYNKGSVVMYQLKEVLGEDRVNEALRNLVDKFGYASAPYPTSLDLLEQLRQVAGAEHQDLLTDLFERIVLYDLRAKQATYRPLDDGKYEVELEFECRKFAMQEVGAVSTDVAEGESLSSQWIEVEEPMDEWVEIGAFAAPPRGKRYGETLYRQRVRAVTGLNRATFIVDELPHQAGVDPFCLQIDRVPDDNLKTVTRAP